MTYPRVSRSRPSTATPGPKRPGFRGTRPRSRYQFEIGVHDFQLAGLVQVPIEDPDFLVYAGLGGGVTILDTSKAVGETAKFSFSLSLGVKRYYSRHVGLRFEARWIPAYLWTSPEGVDICDVNDVCFNTGEPLHAAAGVPRRSDLPVLTAPGADGATWM